MAFSWSFCSGTTPPNGSRMVLSLRRNKKTDGGLYIKGPHSIPCSELFPSIRACSGSVSRTRGTTTTTTTKLEAASVGGGVVRYHHQRHNHRRYCLERVPLPTALRDPSSDRRSHDPQQHCPGRRSQIDDALGEQTERCCRCPCRPLHEPQLQLFNAPA